MIPRAAPLRRASPRRGTRRRAHASSRAVATRRTLAWGGVLAVVGLAGCSLPTTDAPAPATDPAEAPVGSATPDPARDELVVQVGRLRTTVTEAREGFAGALDAGGPAAARAAADTALELLIAPPGASADDLGDDEARPLFPAEPSDRGASEDVADQLTLTLTQAREVGGGLGNQVLDLLRDPIAGDLGAWQRDAEGVLASIDETIAGATTLEEQEAAVAELPGLGTRAIAWARLTADASSTEDAQRYAERGVANLDVILVTLDRLELPS